MTALRPTDPCSYSRPDQCVVVEIDLDLNVDFSNTSLKGYVHLTLEKKQDSIDHVVRMYLRGGPTLMTLLVFSV